jgi:nitrogen regulatory protein PII-like uncharacterized protein
MAEFENKVIDRRTVARYLRKGIVDERDFEKYLKALPDLADQAVPIEAAMEGEDDFEDDDDEE